MEGLASWVRQIILIALLAGVVEMIMPETSSKRYTHLAMGLLAMLSILMPFLNLLKQEIDWKDAFGLSGAGTAPAMTQTVNGEATRRLQERQRQLIMEVFRERLNARAEELCSGVAGVRRARARVDLDELASSPRYGSVIGAEVEVETDAKGSLDSGTVAESVREVVSEAFGISRSSVSVIVKPAVDTEGGLEEGVKVRGGEGVGVR